MTPPDDPDGVSRRAFLISASGLATTAWIGAQWPSIAAAAHHAEMAADQAGAPAWTGFQFLSAAEAMDVEAVAVQIVPSGATPGAREARAVRFIDRALATFFAAWSADYRRGLLDWQATFRSAHPAVVSFAAASPELQAAHLATVDQTPFFDTTRMLTILGMFASPTYGGNFEGAGWRMIGFEDRHAFAPPFGFYDAQYRGFVPYT
jgi:gluconate 2-dehydrogenase gamma chain